MLLNRHKEKRQGLKPVEQKPVETKPEVKQEKKTRKK
jgi:hypothetical protein